jgi:trimethylamine--corrinoid protein Co-methyltransferase
MFEKTMTGLPPVLAGADIIFGPAVLSSEATYSLEQLVIDDEIASALTRMRKGMKVNQESLAVELINRVGPGGSFVGARHTLKHLKADVWSPSLVDRNIEDNWMKEGSESMCSKARKMALDILSNHEVKPLDQEQKRDIDKVMKAAAKI